VGKKYFFLIAQKEPFDEKLNKWKYIEIDIVFVSGSLWKPRYGKTDSKMIKSGIDNSGMNESRMTLLTLSGIAVSG